MELSKNKTFGLKVTVIDVTEIIGRDLAFSQRLYIPGDLPLLDPPRDAEWVPGSTDAGAQTYISEWTHSSPCLDNLWHIHVARFLPCTPINRVESFNLKWERYLLNMKEP